LKTAIEAMFKAAEATPKQASKPRISLHIETEVVEWFQARGEYYQANINPARRFYISQHSKLS